MTDGWTADPALLNAIQSRVHWISRSGLIEVLRAMRDYHAELRRIADRDAQQSCPSEPSDPALPSPAEAEKRQQKAMGFG